MYWDHLTSYSRSTFRRATIVSLWFSMMKETPLEYWCFQREVTFGLCELGVGRRMSMDQG
jgi:hypothetical protein